MPLELRPLVVIFILSWKYEQKLDKFSLKWGEFVNEQDIFSILASYIVGFSRFSEMPTNNFIESSFWNFDALFQPQQHPARDAHDTFFLKGNSKFFSVLIIRNNKEIRNDYCHMIRSSVFIWLYTVTWSDPQYSYDYTLCHMIRSSVFIWFPNGVFGASQNNSPIWRIWINRVMIHSIYP